jgi:hypothetical protein
MSALYGPGVGASGTSPTPGSPYRRLHRIGRVRIPKKEVDAAVELWELSAREACRDTLAQYTHSGDRYLLEDFTGAFCEDGVLEIRGAEALQGRDAIMARFGGAPAAAQAQEQAAQQRGAGAKRRIVRHNVTNIRFESVQPDEALVASYFTVITEIGLDHMGRYRDRFVPVGVDGRWLIAHRFVSTDWRSPETTFGPP